MLASLGLVLVAAYTFAVLRVSGEVAQGTSVRGLDIGGMTKADAAARLERTFGPGATAAVALKLGAEVVKVDPAKAGLTVDWDATAEQGARLILNPVTLARHLFGFVPIEPVRTIDSAQLHASLTTVASRTDVRAVEPTITFTSAARPKLGAGVSARALDVDAAAATVQEQWFRGSGAPIELPVTVTRPTVSEAAAARAFDSVARPAVSGPIVVEVGTTELKVTPRTVAAALTFAPRDGALVAELDAATLRKALADDLAPLERKPQDASIVIRDGRPVVLASQKGRTVTAAAVAAGIMPALSVTDPDERIATVKVTQVKPAFTTADAKALGIKEQLSTFRQPFPPAAYRYQNVGRAAAYLNGTIIKPGETFSMNGTIHERTAANGYTKGFIISGGRFREEQGGGVSIITTATWTAGFYAGLERVESHPHGLYISRYRAGLEATVAWGLLDLKLRNDTGKGVLITAVRDSSGVRVSFWGTKKYDVVRATFTPRHSFRTFTTIRDSGPRCVPSQGVQGFSISVTRHLIRGGKTVATQTWPTYYKPTPHVICAS